MAVLSMSNHEFSRLEVLLRVQSGRLRVAAACELIGLHRRQVFRLLRGLKQDGATSLLSKHRGKPSNHRLPAEVRILALSIVRGAVCRLWPDTGGEKLAEHHGCSVSRETLRGWMIADGLWQDRRLVSPPRISRAGDAIAWANWCRSTARSTPGSRTAVRRPAVSSLLCRGVSSLYYFYTISARNWLSRKSRSKSPRRSNPTSR